MIITIRKAISMMGSCPTPAGAYLFWRSMEAARRARDAVPKRDRRTNDGKSMVQYFETPLV